MPDTATEICALQKATKAADDDVYLGARATKANLLALDTTGRLAAYRIVDFATHGLLPEETRSYSRSEVEPSLVMTPSADASQSVDNGLLLASEVAKLHIAADLVILSACNTASGQTIGGQSLSGLARAFIYAGSRAVVASEWSVDSASSVQMLTGMLKDVGSIADLSRAMQRAEVAFMSSGDPLAEHPRYWAPFIVVGDGGIQE